MSIRVNDFIEVVSKTTGETVMAGRVKIMTANPFGYSLDGILFVNPNSDQFSINISESFIDKQPDINDLCSQYKVIPHNNIDNTFEYDFFTWNAIEDEVKEIVELLNQVDGVSTYSSCSGHGVIPPYVDFYVEDYNKFSELLKYLRENNNSSRTYKHNEIQSKHRFIIGVEEESTVHLEGTEINSNFEDLCKAIKRYLRKRHINE